MKNEIVELGLDLAYSKNSGALYQWSNSDTVNSGRPGMQVEKQKGIAYYKWGTDNLWPQNVRKKIAESHQKGQLLEKERNFLIGAGIWPFEMTIVDGKFSVKPVEDTEMYGWADDSEAWDRLLEIAEQYVFSNNVFIQFFFNVFGEFTRIEVLDSMHCRLEEANRITGEIDHVYVTDWADKANIDNEKNPLLKVPLYKVGMEKLNFPPNFVLHIKNPKAGQSNYSMAAWWGTLNWTEVANLIPLFHKNGLLNGYNIRYHVDLPINLLQEYTGDERESKKMEIQKAMDEKLAGVDDTSSTIISWFHSDMHGKPMPGVKITPLNNNNPSGEYIELDKQANINQASGHGINPVLAGIDTGGKLGGSGSEMRIAYQLHIALNTPIPRKLILKPFHLIHKLKGWNVTKPNRYFDFLEIDITTLDENPTGKQTTTIGANAT